MRVTSIKCQQCGNVDLPVAEGENPTKCRHCGTWVWIDWEGHIAQDALLSLGLDYLKAGNYEMADSYFSKALNQDSRNRAGWFWKAIVIPLKDHSDEPTRGMPGAEVSDNFFRRNVRDRKAIEEANYYWRQATFTLKESVDSLVPVLSDSVGSTVMKLRYLASLRSWPRQLENSMACTMALLCSPWFCLRNPGNRHHK